MWALQAFSALKKQANGSSFSVCPPARFDDCFTVPMVRAVRTRLEKVNFGALHVPAGHVHFKSVVRKKSQPGAL